MFPYCLYLPPDVSDYNLSSRFFETRQPLLVDRDWKMEKNQNGKITLRMIIAFSVYVLLFGSTPILVSGKINWWQGWVYAFLTILTAVGSRLFVARKNPDLLVERGRSAEQGSPVSWDKVLAPLVGVIGPLISLFICGLDKRFSWSPPMPLWLSVIGLVLGIAASLFSSWALFENRFFSGVVRIQNERGQHVVETGPYRIIRHPGYSGAGLNYLLSPIFLGTPWGLVPALITCILLVIRTSLEDKMLLAMLPGYGDYAKRTRFRLVPGVW